MEKKNKKNRNFARRSEEAKLQGQKPIQGSSSAMKKRYTITATLNLAEIVNFHIIFGCFGQIKSSLSSSAAAVE